MAQWLLAVAGGAAVGWLFGLLQDQARRRYERLQQAGALRNEWAVVRGSSRRVMLLLIALGLAQIFCPSLFTRGRQWWFSGGVLAGYALALLRQVRLRMSRAK